MNGNRSHQEQMTELKQLGNPKGVPNFEFRDLEWSPDGKHIVVSVQDHSKGSNPLFILDIETGKLSPLTRDQFDFRPAWSPDGGKIAFRRWARGMSPILLIDVETRQMTELIDIGNTFESYFTWSPEGRKILYSTNNVLHLFDIGAKQSHPFAQVEGIIVGLSWWDGSPQAVYPSGKLATTWGQLKRHK